MTQPYSIVSSTSARSIRILSSRGALGRSYSSRVYFRKLHHALRTRRSTSMDRSALWLAFPLRYTNSFVWLYTWPTVSTLNVAVDSGIPFARKHMISVLASDTVRPNTFRLCEGPQHYNRPLETFFSFNLTYSRWTSSCITILPVDLPLSPRFTPYDFFRDASSALLQLVNQCLNFAYSRSHAFRHERKNTNLTLVRIELTTSALAGVHVTYQIDHSGDEG